MKTQYMLIVIVGALFGLTVEFYLHATNRVLSREPVALLTVDERYADLPRHAAVVMLGDSITAFADWNALLPSFDIVNRGISGDTTAGVLKRIGSIVAMRPHCIAVMLGINDIMLGRDLQQTVGDYETIISQLASSATTVLAQSTLLPEKDFTRFRQPVIQLNQSIETICRQSSDCRYIDLNPTLASSGTIETVDGIHLTPKSYRLWATAIAPWLDGCR
jgi:lysophospholipase L1-like esterase